MPVTDDSVLDLQQRINVWLDGRPTPDDRKLASLTAVMVMLVTPAMMRRRGENPALLVALRLRRERGMVQEHHLWRNPLRVVAAASVAARLLRHDASPQDVATMIEDLRTIDHREAPWRLDVMDWAYGPALRSNLYVDELMRRGVITAGAYRRH